VDICYEAADAIESQAREIKSLRAYCKTVDQLRAKNDRYKKRYTELIDTRMRLIRAAGKYNNSAGLQRMYCGIEGYLREVANGN
jgi:hypothetical protein